MCTDFVKPFPFSIWFRSITFKAVITPPEVLNTTLCNEKFIHDNNLYKESKKYTFLHLCPSGSIEISLYITFAQIQSWWMSLGLLLSPGFPASRGKLYCMTALYWSLNINTPCNFKKKRLIIFSKWQMKTQMLISSQEWISYCLYFDEVQLRLWRMCLSFLFWLERNFNYK